MLRLRSGLRKGGADMVELNRRGFLVGAGLTAAGTLAGNEKVLSGGLAEVTPPGVPERSTPLVPPGARSLAAFKRACVACQLCVQQCPNHVLRPSTDRARFLLPEMGFERGYCRPECTRCGEVCPAGAIRRVTPEEKRNIHLGHAIWHRERCLAVTDGISCDVCARHCPVKAIVRIPLDDANVQGPKVPAVDKLKCIACGACEHLCPARPLPGLTVKGFEKHREVKPMGDQDVLAEARKLLEAGKVSVLLAKDGVFIASGNGRGLGPLLGLLDTRPAELKGAWVIDKVVGKAAAALCVKGGATRVHAELMGQAGADLLKANGIAFSATEIVPLVLNRDKTGSCPLEATVKDLADVDEMLAAIRAKLAELRKAPQTT